MHCSSQCTWWLLGLYLVSLGVFLGPQTGCKKHYRMPSVRDLWSPWIKIVKDRVGVVSCSTRGRRIRVGSIGNRGILRDIQVQGVCLTATTPLLVLENVFLSRRRQPWVHAVLRKRNTCIRLSLHRCLREVPDRDKTGSTHI